MSFAATSILLPKTLPMEIWVTLRNRRPTDYRKVAPAFC